MCTDDVRVGKKYVYVGEDSEELTRGKIVRVVDSLYDRFSVYLEDEECDAYWCDIAASELEPIVATKTTTHACNCPNHILFAHGCQCGGK